MTTRMKTWMLLAVLVGPAVGAAQTSRPIVPTGPGDTKNPTEIGDKPPPDPTDEGGVCPEPPGSY
ncbi:hypothetical protein LY474_39200 [Myxococcus stipitatus]|uniref:hypothetical protein n=1 Tax=Myxococcus stipitatus TaxID=83455 RepID=UPI001F40917C|nr:hypothetical protein [Myxococcus stipitatus]MCE9673839.1 hypothetical protein [Myxococcus stipitatus]